LQEDSKKALEAFDVAPIALGRALILAVPASRPAPPEKLRTAVSSCQEEVARLKTYFHG
jgi:hypothetical protein